MALNFDNSNNTITCTGESSTINIVADNSTVNGQAILSFNNACGSAQKIAGESLEIDSLVLTRVTGPFQLGELMTYDGVTLRLHGLSEPVAPGDAATRKYVDAAISATVGPVKTNLIFSTSGSLDMQELVRFAMPYTSNSVKVVEITMIGSTPESSGPNNVFLHGFVTFCTNYSADLYLGNGQQVTDPPLTPASLFDGGYVLTGAGSSKNDLANSARFHVANVAVAPAPGVPAIPEVVIWFAGTVNQNLWNITIAVTP